MRMGNAFRFIQELSVWYHGDGDLAKANDCLVAPHQWLFNTLWEERVLNGDGRPIGAVSCQQIIDIVLLHIAMRKGF